jgi:hypothetical protein
MNQPIPNDGKLPPSTFETFEKSNNENLSNPISKIKKQKLIGDCLYFI